MSRAALPLACAFSALLSLLPRAHGLEHGWRLSPDGAEYLLLARSLARGEGFTLPIRVRWPSAAPGPTVHAAWEERAPLWPWLLSLAGDEAGWPGRRVLLPGLLLCALAAAQAAELAAALARRSGLGPKGAVSAALGAGITVALAPTLVEAWLHGWAEPAALVLALAAARLLVGLEGGAAAFALGLVAGAAHLARPEAWVLALAVPIAVFLRARRALGPCLAGVALAAGASVALTGVLVPQSFLLSVGDYRQVMREDPDLAPPGLWTILRGAGGNALGLLAHLATPRYAAFALPLALLALGRPAARPTLALAAALGLATAAVWSTSHPERFGIAPLALLAPVAAVELERRRRALLGRATWPRAVWLVLLLLLLWWPARDERRRPPPARPAPVPEPGEAAVPDPWAYAVVTGRPARLARPPVAGQPR